LPSRTTWSVRSLRQRVADLGAGVFRVHDQSAVGADDDILHLQLPLGGRGRLDFYDQEVLSPQVIGGETRARDPQGLGDGLALAVLLQLAQALVQFRRQRRRALGVVRDRRIPVRLDRRDGAGQQLALRVLGRARQLAQHARLRGEEVLLHLAQLAQRPRDRLVVFRRPRRRAAQEQDCQEKEWDAM